MQIFNDSAGAGRVYVVELQVRIPENRSDACFVALNNTAVSPGAGCMANKMV